MKEASKALVDLLEAKVIADVYRWPRVVSLEIPDEVLPAVLETDEAWSISKPGHKYRMIRTPSGWYHTTTDCYAWLRRATCHHVEERNEMTMAMQTVLSPGALDIIDELDEVALFKDVGSEITPAWAYSFPMDGKNVTGLSAVGVEQASLELAKKGMALREIDVRVEYEDDREARFVAYVGRYAVSETGGQTLLDSAVRGKRVSKWERRADGKGEYFNKNWFEHGVTKAARNAKRALLPEAVVSYVLAQAIAAGKVAQSAPRNQVQQATSRPQVQAPRPAPDANCEHVAVFDEKSTLLVCSKCGVVLEEEPGGPVQKPLT